MYMYDINDIRILILNIKITFIYYVLKGDIMASKLLNKISQKNNMKMHYNKTLYIVAKQLL